MRGDGKSDFVFALFFSYVLPSFPFLYLLFFIPIDLILPFLFLFSLRPCALVLLIALDLFLSLECYIRSVHMDIRM